MPQQKVFAVVFRDPDTRQGVAPKGPSNLAQAARPGSGIGDKSIEAPTRGRHKSENRWRQQTQSGWPDVRRLWTAGRLACCVAGILPARCHAGARRSRDSGRDARATGFGPVRAPASLPPNSHFYVVRRAPRRGWQSAKSCDSVSGVRVQPRRR